MSIFSALRSGQFAEDDNDVAKTEVPGPPKQAVERRASSCDSMTLAGQERSV